MNPTQTETPAAPSSSASSASLSSGYVLVKSRGWRLARKVPSSLKGGGFFTNTFHTVPRAGLIAFLMDLTKGQPRRFVPAEPQLFEVLKEHGLLDPAVARDASVRRLCIVASSVVENSPIKDVDVLFVGEIHSDEASGKGVGNSAETTTTTESVVKGAHYALALTVAEAALKDATTTGNMLQALSARVDAALDVTGEGSYTCVRIGEKILAVRRKVGCPATETDDAKASDAERQRREKLRALLQHRGIGALDSAESLLAISEAAQLLPPVHPIDVSLLRLLPGIGKIYDTRGLAQDGSNFLSNVLCRGAGGVPIQSRHKALCLLSGGLDSPVAAYHIMRRGCRVDFVHFLNSTSDTTDVLKKIHGIVARLSCIQGRADLHIVDISQLQNAIIAAATRTDRTLLYKLWMLMLGASIGTGEYQFLVTGDSVGQVASQTPENLGALYPQVGRAIVSPLSGSNKSDIVRDSRLLGLYDLSIQAGADCCQYLTCTTGANIAISAQKLRKYLLFKGAVVDVVRVQNVSYNGGKESVQLRRIFEVTLDEVRAANPRAFWHAKATSAIAPHNGEDEEKDSETARKPKPFTNTTSSAAGARYLDTPACSLVHPDVVHAVATCPKGNANSVHSMGRAARQALEAARHDLLNETCTSDPNAMSVVFTSCGTEANNIAIQGLAAEAPGGCVYPSLSHPSVRNVVEAMFVPERRTLFKYHSTGHVDVAAFADDLKRMTTAGGRVLVCVDLVNHELGVVQPVEDIRKLCRDSGALLHVDACQALLKLPIDASLYDTCSFSGHKINGPLGVGAVVVRRDLIPKMSQTQYGGSYDGVRLRPGTENVPGIVGFAAALSLPRYPTDAAFQRLVSFFSSDAVAPFVRLDGGGFGSSDAHCHAILHLTLRRPPHGCSSEMDIVAAFSARHGIMVSSGAACSLASPSDAPSASEKLYRTLGVDPGLALRVGLDSASATLEDDVAAFCEAFSQLYKIK
eukprot:PhM_4_TR18426/c0_g1_i2/m.85242/K04487/iscS, NFS1; cysteine desulfurase